MIKGFNVSVYRYDYWAITITRNAPNGRDLFRVVWEWNPFYRGRRLWRLWRLWQFTPYILVNEYHEDSPVAVGTWWKDNRHGAGLEDD